MNHRRPPLFPVDLCLGFAIQLLGQDISTNCGTAEWGKAGKFDLRTISILLVKEPLAARV